MKTLQEISCKAVLNEAQIRKIEELILANGRFSQAAVRDLRARRQRHPRHHLRRRRVHHRHRLRTRRPLPRTINVIRQNLFFTHSCPVFVPADKGLALIRFENSRQIMY